MASVRATFADLIMNDAQVDAPRVRDAFAKVPRERFLGPGPWLLMSRIGYVELPADQPSSLYQNRGVALDADEGINNGEPTLHAICLAGVAPLAGERVVHVGAGTGYYTAILAELVGPEGVVEAFEINPELANKAVVYLKPWPQTHMHIRSALDETLAESDVIYASAGLDHPPERWLHALSLGGRLVMPLTPTDKWGAMLMVTRRSQGFDATFLCRAGFIDCVGGKTAEGDPALKRAFASSRWREVRSLHLGEPGEDETVWYAGKGWWLSVRSLAERSDQANRP
ncbi:MAG: protein-L-isoaspartate O-methyltransferase [Geminicoccaceae bacterium]